MSVRAPVCACAHVRILPSPSHLLSPSLCLALLACALRVSQIRIMRAFRLLRVFQKISDLQKIITAVTMSIIPAFEALVSTVSYHAPRLIPGT